MKLAVQLQASRRWASLLAVLLVSISAGCQLPSLPRSPIPVVHQLPQFQVGQVLHFRFEDASAPHFWDTRSIDSITNAIRNRLAYLGVERANVTLTRTGDLRIELPAGLEPVGARITSVLRRRGPLALHVVSEEDFQRPDQIARLESREVQTGLDPVMRRVLVGGEATANAGRKIAVEAHPNLCITPLRISDVFLVRDRSGHHAVNFVPSPELEGRLRRLTRFSAGRNLAIVSGNSVEAVVTIAQEAGAGLITGPFLPDEVDRLLDVFTAGALPGAFHRVEGRTRAKSNNASPYTP